MNKNVILINAYPINDHRTNLLYDQLINLKELNLPIILCSGCEIPSKIYPLVDYAIINKEKIIKPATYNMSCYIDGKGPVSGYFNEHFSIFDDNVDPTIARNIKLLFNYAKNLGFENALYAEDDNLFINPKEYSDFHFNILSTTHKMCGVLDIMIMNPYEHSLLHTTHFFSNIEFLLENFTYPHDLNELLSESTKHNLQPYKMFEIAIYNCFKNKLDEIYNISREYQLKFLDLSKQEVRDDNIDFIIKNRLFICKSNTQKYYFGFLNTSKKLIFNIVSTTSSNSVKFDGLNFNMWYTTHQINLNDQITLTITDQYNNTRTRTIIFENYEKVAALANFD